MTSRVAVVAETALGYAGVVLGRRGIERATLFRPTRRALEDELCAMGTTEGDDPRAATVRGALQQYASGTRDALETFPIDLTAGTEQQRRVWLTLRTIPPGQTRSYRWLAEATGMGAGGARAAGMMNGQNPVPLWLPCHRVIASDGSLGGFAGGLPMKQQLLELEGALPRRMFA